MTRLGQQLGNYRLIRLLGSGGFAEVYLGEHIHLKTLAAIKVLQMRLEETEFKGFLHEAQTIAHLEHPHIVRILDFGLENSTPFIVMQYAPNGSLRQLYADGSILSLAKVVEYTSQVASALQFAHKQKVIHRDVKPENMLLAKDGKVLLSDFGVAIVTHSSRETSEGEISGTVAYMPPEQLQGKACPASDQYALGVVVYEWLCGVRPFRGSFAEIAAQHLQTHPRSLLDRGAIIGHAVEQVVFKALAKNPAERFASIEDFASALKEASDAGATTQKQRSNSELSGIISTNQTEQAWQGQVQSKEDAKQLRLWNIPFRRNPFFTGREDILQSLYAELRSSRQRELKQPQAICGLSGVGKTQTATEFAYRYSLDYKTILWARADSYEMLRSEFVAIARLLQLPEANEQDEGKSVEAVKLWLATQDSWLLVVDDIDELAMLDDFIPATYQGDILLTTCTQATGIFAHAIELEKMGLDEGALFLLRRSKLIKGGAAINAAQAADYIEAKDICRAMDGLPLALDQAGAYIEETGCSLFDYLVRYREQSKLLLDLRGGTLGTHPEPVATTWVLSFEKVEQAHPAAAELLKLCAFLYGDGIFEALITEGATDLGTLLGPVAMNTLQLDKAIATLRKFSLVKRNAETRILTMHRLVQGVLRQRMQDVEQREWAIRAIRTVNRAFPEGDNVAGWRRCQQCMPHVLLCVQFIDEWELMLPEAARLLDQAGVYLFEHAQYSQAIFLLKKALQIREQVKTSDNFEVAESLNNLAGCYLFLGKYTEAEPLLKRAMEIRLKLATNEDVEVAVALNNLALLYKYQGRYAEAEPLFQQALAIWEKSGGAQKTPKHTQHNNLALLYQVQGRLSQAEELYKRGLAIWEDIRGPIHPDVAVSLNNLAILCQRMGKFAQAELLFQRVMEIREQTLGPEHPAVAHSLAYLAKLYQFQWKYAEAELLFKQALTIRRHSLGPEHPEVAHSLYDLARLYYTQGNYAQSEQFFQEALQLRERVLGPEHPAIATLLRYYAVLLLVTHRKDEARKLIRRAKTIQIRHSGQYQPQTVAYAVPG